MKLFSTIRFVLTLKCKDSMRIASAGLDRRLDPVERMALWGHLLVCRACRSARRQMKFIKDLLMFRAEEGALGEGGVRALSAEARQRIQEAILRKLEQPGA